jgi:hypothetical protein
MLFKIFYLLLVTPWREKHLESSLCSGIALNVWYLLGQIPGGVLLFAILVVFVVVLLVLTNEKACNNLVKVLEAFRKH